MNSQAGQPGSFNAREAASPFRNGFAQVAQRPSPVLASKRGVDSGEESLDLLCLWYFELLSTNGDTLAIPVRFFAFGIRLFPLASF
jgi:hypothetical protein